MADFAPPSGPPPPKVPPGWKAVWNEQYSEWFYVNTYTKKSQWDKPTEAVYGPDDDAPPGGPPPTYDQGSARPAPAEKPLASNNPYAQPNISEDEALARKLQEEENARAGHPGSSNVNRGESDSFYQGGGGYPPQDQGQAYAGDPAAAPQKKGLLGKVFGKSSSRPPQQQQQYYGGQQGYPQQGGYPPQGYYGGPPQGGGYYGGGYQQQPQYYQQAPPPRRQGGGLGTGGALALGAGGGLLGGMLLGEAIDGGDDGGGDGGGDFGGDGGGDGGGGGD